jgi:hypothetical protein
MTRMGKRGWSAVTVACWALVGLTGCGGAYDSSVSGVVTLDGSPIGRGTVAYHPVGGGPAGYARIDENSEYSVRTGREEGLPSGEYDVTVVANEPPAVERTTLGGPPPPGKPITPPWYRSPQTSGLRFAVEEGSNEINLELSTEPPPGYDPRRRR